MVSINSSNGIFVCDSTDKQILELLQENAKFTIKEISDRTGKSPTAVRSRIQGLEKDIIKKYMALIDCSKLGYREMVMASLRVNSRRPLEQIKEEIEKMQKIKLGLQS